MKKKLLVLLLVLALVFSSAMTLLVACNPDDSDEYVITFRLNTKKLFELTTKDSKISKADVEAKEEQFKRQLLGREAEGFVFTGWYATVTEDEDGKNVYSDAINYARKYNDDADYEAGFDFLPMSGEEAGYTLIGVINGYKDWEPGNVNEAWILEPSETEGWMYSITLDLQPGDQIKIKTTGVGWDEGKVNIGYERLNEVTIADGVTVDLKDNLLKGGLINQTSDGNLFISYLVESLNATIIFNYRTTKFDMVINSMTVLDAMPEFNYILVGSMNDWNDHCTDPEFIFTEEDGDTLSITYTFKEDDKWLVTYNDGAWGFKLDASSYSYSRVTKDESIIDEIPQDLFTDAGSGDIVATYNCTVKLTVKISTKQLFVHVTAITIPDADTIFWESEGYAVMGLTSWDFPISDSKYLFVQDAKDKNIGTITLTLNAGNAFKVSTNSSWNGRINIGWYDGLTAYDKNDQPIANLLEKNGDNIRVRTDCTITITLNVRAKTIKIVVTEDVEVPPVTDDPDTREWGICGTLTGWGSDMMLTNQADGHKTLSGQALAAGVEFKIRAERAWSDSVGWHNENVKFVAGSGVDSVDGVFVEGSNGGGLSNIKVVKACTVDIDLYYVNDSNWVLVITVTSIG